MAKKTAETINVKVISILIDSMKNMAMINAMTPAIVIYVRYGNSHIFNANRSGFSFSILFLMINWDTAMIK